MAYAEIVMAYLGSWRLRLMGVARGIDGATGLGPLVCALQPVHRRVRRRRARRGGAAPALSGVTLMVSWRGVGKQTGSSSRPAAQ